MWALSGAVFLGCKWLMLQEAIARGETGSLSNKLAFLFAWPGMNPQPFLRGRVRSAVSLGEWAFAIGKVLFGAALFWGVARLAGGGMLSAWIGMIGLIFMLHFGSFHVLALFWRSVGVPVEPLMKNPVAAVSLGEFWGRRWNAAFNEIVELLIFRPLGRSRGIAIASMAAFFASGLIHDFVISVPARGGYGLPTFYFLLQGFGVWFERSAFGKRLRLRRGCRGWLFTFAVTAGPAYLLFHPPFARAIMLPMMSDTLAL